MAWRTETAQTDRARYVPTYVRITRVPWPNDTSDATSGSGLWRMHPFIGEPAVVNSVFWAMRIRNIGDQDNRWRLLASAIGTDGSGLNAFNVSKAESERSGEINFSASNGGASVADAEGAFGYFGWSGSIANSSTDYIIAASLRTAPSDMIGYSWHGGWTSNPARPGTRVANSATVPTRYPEPDMTFWNELFTIFGHNYKFDGLAAWVWFHAAADQSAWVDLRDESQRNQLLGNPETFTFPTPLVWFQGPASEWNAGHNRGTGGDFTAGAPITDVTDWEPAAGSSATWEPAAGSSATWEPAPAPPNGAWT